MIHFVPHEDVSKLFPTELSGDDGMLYVSQLESVPESSNLYYVYAFDQPIEAGGKKYLVGTLQLESELTRTLFGD